MGLERLCDGYDRRLCSWVAGMFVTLCEALVWGLVVTTALFVFVALPSDRYADRLVERMWPDD